MKKQFILSPPKPIKTTFFRKSVPFWNFERYYIIEGLICQAAEFVLTEFDDDDIL